MRTLHVDLGEEWRGGQHQALELMRGLRLRGHAAELVAQRDSPLARRAGEEGIAVHPVGKFAPQLQAALPLKTLTEPGHIDVVHIHDAHGLTPAWLAGVQRRACLLASRRVVYPLPQNPLALARYRSAHRVVAVSNYVKEVLLSSGLTGEHVEVIHDGVKIPPQPDPAELQRARRRWKLSEGPWIGYVGYFLPDKGHEFLVRALPAVLDRHPRCRLLLPGEGPCRRRLEQLAQELGVQAAVVFPGFVDNVEEVYRALDMFVFPARAEGLGSSLLTAMSYGLPVAAVEQCAVPEVVREGENGLLVPAPKPDLLAAAILRLLDDSSLAHNLGAAARQTIMQSFSVERLVDETLSLYRRLLKEPENPV